MATTKETRIAPRIGFLDLPGELRNQIYMLVVVKPAPETLPLCIMKHDPNYLNLAILRTCKTVYNEAAALFYSQNHFDVSGCAAAHLDQFIDRIGPVHAGQVQHLAIDHPMPVHPCLPPVNYLVWRGPAEIDDRDEATLHKIRKNFTSLTSITTVPESIHYVFYDGTCGLATEHGPTYAPFMRLVDRRFRTIPTLKTIKLRVPSREADLGAANKAMMAELNWEVKGRHICWCEQGGQLMQPAAITVDGVLNAEQDNAGSRTVDEDGFTTFIVALTL